MASRNYLIGRGELLTEPVGPPPIKPTKAHPYTVDEARERLGPQLAATIAGLETEPALSPNDVHVVKFALHPSYVAKSYYPTTLFQNSGLEPVGSRDRVIVPAAHVRANWEDETFATSEIFVAGTRAAFANLEMKLAAAGPLAAELEEIREIEEISLFGAHEKIKPAAASRRGFELVVHLPSLRTAPNNQDKFLALAKSLGFEVRDDLSFEVRGLWFLPADGPVENISRLASYATVRAVRPMPLLSVSPVTRTFVGASASAVLPASPALSLVPRVAILDGGLPNEHALGPWVESYREMNPAAGNAGGYEQHGLAVASAFLFGPLKPGVRGAVPPARISVFRILDDSTASEDPFELYRTLGYVEEILLSRAFDFINLSLGPILSVEDDDVHAWTALIDDLLSDGETLMTVAVGNNGENDWESGNARIQVPSDAVNALAVGSSTGTGAGWQRAAYSAIGPGRSPGRIKPDLLSFGGSPAEYFHFAGEGSVPELVPGSGTSLSAPLALRQAVSIAALLGESLSPLAIRGLLLHSSDCAGHDKREVGWGNLPAVFDDMVVSGDGVARVVYQGEIKPGKYIRAQVPVPLGALAGMVTLSATFVFASPVDTQSPDVYTRAGLEIRFRPDLQKFKEGAKTPSSRSFFSASDFATEDALRSQEGKWETVLDASQRMRGTTLADPVFDIHYNARDGGGASRVSDSLKYALVITLEAPKHSNLHAEILDAYPNLLVAIEPAIDVELPAL
jgi:hypothetical protein